MENGARRMAAVSRHLHPQSLPHPLLQRVLLSGQQNKQSEAMPVVIGGMVLDVLSTPSVPANPRSTTPGQVDFMQGGVARNIAECMAKLGAKCYMISAVGFDMAGELLLAQWESAGLPIAGIQQRKQIRTATVNCMFDVGGELVAGVADVESIERFLTPEWIQQSRTAICSAPLLVVDANMSPSSLEASCQMAGEFNVPVWFEPVSVAKSIRVASVAKHITFASPNELELAAMANALTHGTSFLPIENGQSNKNSPESLFKRLKPAILVLMDNGIKFVVVTLGANGVVLCFRGQGVHTNGLFSFGSHGMGKELYDNISKCCPPRQYSTSTQSEGVSDLSAVHYPALPASVARVSGAGDCLVGGVVASLCSGLNIMQSVAVGVAAAKGAIETETNVPHEYNLRTIADDACSVYSAAKDLFQKMKD